MTNDISRQVERVRGAGVSINLPFRGSPSLFPGIVFLASRGNVHLLDSRQSSRYLRKTPLTKVEAHSTYVDGVFRKSLRALWCDVTFAPAGQFIVAGSQPTDRQARAGRQTHRHTLAGDDQEPTVFVTELSALGRRLLKLLRIPTTKYRD